jgi:hypothetical protein
MHPARPTSIFTILILFAALVIAAGPGTAEAATPGHVVTTNSSAGTVSWATRR